MEKTKKIILIVEDDLFLNRLYSDKLRREGFDVKVASTGTEGLKKAMSSKPDLIILDIMLPQKNGFDVLGELKLNSDTKNIPVVILTNLGQESDAQLGLKLGAVEYIVKTEFLFSKLVEIVRKHLTM